MLTDYVLGVGSLTFGILLLRSRASAAKPLLWAIGFFSAAAAAIVGGTFHGFSAYQSAGLHKALWDATMLLIGASAGFFVSAVLSVPLKGRAENTRWLRAGVVLSVAGVAVQKGGLSLHPSFNHNDLFHCMQTVAFYFFFRGARLSV